MKVKLQSGSKLCLVAAVKKMLGLSLKEARDLVDKQVTTASLSEVGLIEFYVVIDSEKTEEQIKAIAEGCDVTYTPLDVCEQVQPEKGLQEVTDDDLGVSIHSIDEMTIGWQCKMLFTHEQAARVISRLQDAKFNVTEVLVMHKGNKATMLVVTKTFPSGTKSKDLKKFEYLLNRFTYHVCEMINLEERSEGAKERAIEALDELRDYE